MDISLASSSFVPALVVCLLALSFHLRGCFHAVGHGSISVTDVEKPGLAVEVDGKGVHLR
jgi:hypothetical protein